MIKADQLYWYCALQDIIQNLQLFVVYPWIWVL